MKNLKRLAVAAVVLVSVSAFAEVDPATLYEVTTQGTTEAVKAGEKGKVVIEIRAKEGSHVSDEAPLKIELKGQNVTPEKDKLKLADSIAKKAEGQKYANPKFEVPFAAASAGKGSIEANMTFFICTENVCARQKKTVTMNVNVQ